MREDSWLNQTPHAVVSLFPVANWYTGNTLTNAITASRLFDDRAQPVVIGFNGTVLKNLVNGLSRQWAKLGQYW